MSLVGAHTDSSDLRTDAEPGTYTGPTPSPARAWAPWVVIASGVAAIANAVVFVLNLVERHDQQQRLTSDPPSAQDIRSTMDSIRTFSMVALIAAAAFLVVGIIWSMRRRPRDRLHLEGESAVEPALRRVLPFPYWAMWTALVISFVVSFSAGEALHAGMTAQDFVDYRTLLAVGAGFRALVWICWVILVVAATRTQSRREAGSAITLR